MSSTFSLSTAIRVANHCAGRGWMTPDDVADAVGLTKKTVIQSLKTLLERETRFKAEKNAGMYRVAIRDEFYNADYVSRADHEEITVLYCNGHSLSDAGRVLGIDGEKIRRFIARHGMIRPPKSSTESVGGGFDHILNAVFR